MSAEKGAAGRYGFKAGGKTRDCSHRLRGLEPERRPRRRDLALEECRGIGRFAHTRLRQQVRPAKGRERAGVVSGERKAPRLATVGRQVPTTDTQVISNLPANSAMARF